MTTAMLRVLIASASIALASITGSCRGYEESFDAHAV